MFNNCIVKLVPRLILLIGRCIFSDPTVEGLKAKSRISAFGATTSFKDRQRTVKDLRRIDFV